MKRIAICGSMQFYKEMVALRQKLEAFSYQAVNPKSYEECGVINYKNANISEWSELKVEHDLIRGYYNEIIRSQAVLIANYDKNNISGYIGGNTLLEMGFAHVHNREIFLINPIPSMPYTSEIEAMCPIIIGESVDKITNYYNRLPKVFVSSENEIKINAADFGFRDCGLRFDVQGYKTDSQVNEQPMNIDETYKGAVNRLVDLKSKIKGSEYEYLVSIEGGLCKLNKDHNYFSLTVCTIENKKGERRVGILTDLEFPRSITDALKKYPDLGVYAQKELGSIDKDPFKFLSKGKIDRIEILKSAVKKTLVQF